MAAQDKAALKAKSDSAFPSGTGNILAANHRGFNDDVIDSYLNTQETGVQSLLGDLDLQGNDLLNAGNIINEFDGYETAANILSMSPTTFLGQTWWATDEKVPYAAITAVILGANAWQKLTILYDNETDTFNFPTTQDGHTLNAGQEVIFKGVNDTLDSATTLNPKVWKSLGSKPGDEKFKLIETISAADVQIGDTIGINTTNALVGGKPKMLMIGDLNDVNTSAWQLNQRLFIDDNGLLTNLLPPVNGIAVAVVTKVDATTGSLFVDTINPFRISIGVVPTGLTRSYFTADTVVLGSGTFFVAEQDTKGTIALATQNVVVGDDSTVAVAQDHISIAASVNITVHAGFEQGIIQTSIDSAGAEEQITVEIYLASNDGTAIDSGSGLPNGDLGVPPIFVMQSAILNMDVADTFFNFIAGFIDTEVVISVGERVRFHTLASKIGAAGGDKTFTFSYGIDAFTFIDSPAQQVVALQDAYEVSPLISTQVGLDEVVIRRGTLADTDIVFAIENAATTQTFTIDGNGNVTVDGAITSTNYGMTQAGAITAISIAADGSALTNLPTTMQEAYANGEDITTTPSAGPFTLTIGSGSDTDPLIQFFNSASQLRANIDGDGGANFNDITAQEVNARDLGNDSLSSLRVLNTLGSEQFTVNGLGTATANQFVGGGVGITEVVRLIEDNGTPLPAQPTVNFLNATSIVNNAGNSSTDITLPGGGGGGLPIYTQVWVQSRTATQTLNISISTIVIPNVAVDTAVGTVFNPATGILTVTAPTAGRYEMKMVGNVLINGTNAPPVLEVRLVRNGTNIAFPRFPFGAGATAGNFGVSVEGEFQMVNGDVAHIEIFNETGQIASLQGSGLLYNVRYLGT